MADFYTFNVFEMNRDGTTEDVMVVNLDNILTVKPHHHSDMEVLLIDGTTFKAYEYEKFVEDMGRTIHG
jgi:hypothetical protein